MLRIPGKLLPHRGTSYRPPAGSNSRGIVYGDPVPVDRAQVVQKTKLVKNPQGQEVISSTQVYLTDDHPVPVNSLYRVHPGTPWEREALVIAVDHYAHPAVQGVVVAYLE